MKIFCEYEHEFIVLINVAQDVLGLEMPYDFTVNPSEQYVSFQSYHGEDAIDAFNKDGVCVNGMRYKIVRSSNGKMFVTSDEK